MKAIKFLFSLMITLFIGAFSAQALGVSPFITTPIVAAMGQFAPSVSGVVNMAITPEIWQDHIVGNIFKDNEFLNYCFIADEYVIGGTLVHIPQAGAPSGAKKNRTSLPATVTIRQDIDVVYALDEYTTDPRLITNAEDVELSYSKRESVIQEDQAALKELIANWILYKWSTSTTARIVRTSGTSVATHISGSTGNRKALLGVDLKKMQSKFNKDGVSKLDRYALLSTDMYDQLTTDATYNSTRDALRDMNLPEGVIGRLYGFWIMERATVLTADNSTSPVVKTPDDSTGTADNDVVLCWQRNSVERALGSTVAFENKQDATMFGDVYSFLQRMGGRKHRADEKGIGVIIQEAA